MKETDEGLLTIRKSDMSELLKAVLEEAKKPYVDPDKVASAERARQRIREQRLMNEQMQHQRQASCPHRREDSTSAIAWATQSDGITRGVCQHCNRLVVPVDADYKELRKVPDRAPGVIHI